LPGEGGNIFIFAHSSTDILIAARYNSVFYLLHHLESGDLIKLWYQDHEYLYSVTDKLYVSPQDTKYLTATPATETLTLMTCWPPGTSLKRLIVIAKPL
jgi:LPXTG-site transpeptidase (sortase) family protein